MQCKLTIALTTNNRCTYLKEAIRAILCQSYRNYRLFIIDDASTDNTSLIVNEFHDDRITYIRNSINLGLMNNLNKAMNMCKTEYLLITHDDDKMKRNFIKEEISVLENNRNISIVSTNMELIDTNGATLHPLIYPLLGTGYHIYEKHDFLKDFAQGKKYVACPTVMFRMSFINRNSLRFDPAIVSSADSYLWMKINTYKEKIAIIKKPLYQYRIHNQQDNVKNVVSAHLHLYEPAVKLYIKEGLDAYIPPLQMDFFRIIVYTLLVMYVHKKINKDEIRNKSNYMKTIGLWPKNLPLSIAILLILINMPDFIILPTFRLFYKVKKLFSSY